MPKLTLKEAYSAHKVKISYPERDHFYSRKPGQSWVFNSICAFQDAAEKGYLMEDFADA